MAKKRVKFSSRHKGVKKPVKKLKRAIKTKKISPEKHVKHISYDYEGRKKRLEVQGFKEEFIRPIGIKVLVAYLTVLLFFYLSYLFVGFKAPLAVVFGQLIGGVPALLLTAAMIIVLLITIYSIAKRKKWGYHLSLIWFIFGIINSLISLILIGSSSIVTVTRDFLILSSIAVFVINIIAIIYILSEKQYFFAKRFLLKKSRMIDRVFVGLMIIFMVAIISVGCLLGYDFYKTNIKITDSLILELEGKNIAEQEQTCISKVSQEKDICLLILSIKTGSYKKCEEIESEFYRFACMRS
ncbi:hypothetical protein KY308_00635 [Candidatus Woesearchaeota archaeon]|nr:hypothetical protein [Candidatus Woesearchaeota archaeon]